MARRNRKRRAQVRPATIGMAAMVALAVAPWLVYCVLGMRVEQANTQIRLLEQERLSQAESLRRCEAEWNRQKDPVRLDEAIARNGLRLTFAPPERTARVSGDGRLRMPQAMARALAQGRRARAEGEAVARTRR